jgi:hypothetical protein
MPPLANIVGTLIFTLGFAFNFAWAGRPFMIQVSKPMATGADPTRVEAFERPGRESVLVRRAKQGMTAGLGVVLLGEAVLRVRRVWSHPESDVLVSSLRSQVWGIGHFVVWFALVKLVFVPIASREVDGFMPTALHTKESSS